MWVYRVRHTLRCGNSFWPRICILGLRLAVTKSVEVRLGCQNAQQQNLEVLWEDKFGHKTCICGTLSAFETTEGVLCTVFVQLQAPQAGLRAVVSESSNGNVKCGSDIAAWAATVDSIEALEGKAIYESGPFATFIHSDKPFSPTRERRQQAGACASGYPDTLKSLRGMPRHNSNPIVPFPLQSWSDALHFGGS